MFRTARTRPNPSAAAAIAMFAATAFNLALPPGDALACSCAEPNAAETFGMSDAVFVGRVRSVDAQVPELQDVMTAFSWSSIRALWYTQTRRSSVDATFNVDTVFKGSVASEAVVQTEASSASCGSTFSAGQRYLVFAVLPGSRYSDELTDADISNMRANPDELSELMDQLVQVPAGRLYTTLCFGNTLYNSTNGTYREPFGEGGTPAPAGTATAAGAEAAKQAAEFGWSITGIQTRVAMTPVSPGAPSSATATAPTQADDAGGAGDRDGGSTPDRRLALGGLAIILIVVGLSLQRRNS